jgi:hypothetical protein
MVRLRVWDPWVRLVHWGVALLLPFSWWTAETSRYDLHFLSGYAILTLVLFRFAWGVVGSETARFARFVKGPKAVLAHLVHPRDRQVGAEVGHNAAGGVMVLVLLALLLTQALSGLFADDLIFTRGPLARRFGPAIAQELAALRGAIAPFTPIRPPPRHVAARDFLSPLVTAPGLERMIGALITTLCGGLLASGEGARVLRLTAFRADGSWQELRQGLGRASRDPAHIHRLMARRVEELRPELGFERLVLAAEVTEPFTPHQPGLPGEDTAPEELATLLDRLGQRVKLWRLAPHASHWPERAIRRVSPFAATAAFTAAPRPVRLLRRPLPLEAVALLRRFLPKRAEDDPLRRVFHELWAAFGARPRAGELVRRGDFGRGRLRRG